MVTSTNMVDVALNLRSKIRQAIPGIDSYCLAAGAGCECALCLSDALGRRIMELERELGSLRQTLSEDCCLKTEANQRIANAQSEAANIFNPFVKLATRVVEIFQPMQDKGQNGQTFEQLLERAKKCLAGKDI